MEISFGSALTKADVGIKIERIASNILHHMKAKTNIIAIWLTTAALFYLSGPGASAQTQVSDPKRTSQATDTNSPQKSATKPLSNGGQSTVVRDRVPGSFLSPNAGLPRISGKVK